MSDLNLGIKEKPYPKKSNRASANLDCVST